MLQPGEKLGDWIVEGALGQGAMGSVYRCHHTVTDRLRAAVKVIRLADIQDGGRWFLREVEALARLSHPGIVGIRSPGVDTPRGLLYIAMELVEGETLLSVLRRGPLPIQLFRRIFIGVAQSLAFAHAHGIYHRDIKPSNIMLRPDGSPVLVDFGVAVDLEAGEEALESRIGTPSYMPPEAFLNAAVDSGKADMYALGVLMMEALTGRRAFDRPPGGDDTHYQAVRKQKAASAPLDPGEGYPEDLRALVRAATEPWPDRRVLSMDNLALALQSADTGSSTLVPQDSLPFPSRSLPTRPLPPPPSLSQEPSGTLAAEDDSTEWTRWILGAVVAALVLSAIAGTLTWWWSSRAAG